MNMGQPDFLGFTALPPNVRVRWLEEYEGLSIAPHRAVRTWDGTVHGGEHMWCDRDGYPSVPESRAVARCATRDGTVLGFCAGVLLVAGDDGRILTLKVNEVRRLP